MKPASTWEVPRQSWESFLAEVEALQRDRLVELEVIGSEMGDQPLARDARLRAISAPTKGSGAGTIELDLGIGVNGELDHRVLQPARLYAIQAPSGQLQCLDIEDASRAKTLVRFKEPRALPVGSVASEGDREWLVGAHMSTPAHVLETGSSIADAYALMRQHGIRHLPVVERGGRLAGVLSDRDVHVAKRERGISPDDVTVEELMVRSPYSVPSDTPLDEVAATMAEKKYGCTVVVEEGRVVGILTTTDALRAFVRLRAQGRRSSRPGS